MKALVYLIFFFLWTFVECQIYYGYESPGSSTSLSYSFSPKGPKHKPKPDPKQKPGPKYPFKDYQTRVLEDQIYYGYESPGSSTSLSYSFSPKGPKHKPKPDPKQKPGPKYPFKDFQTRDLGDQNYFGYESPGSSGSLSYVFSFDPKLKPKPGPPKFDPKQKPDPKYPPRTLTVTSFKEEVASYFDLADIDAAVFWPTNNKLYFFKGDTFIEYDPYSSSSGSNNSIPNPSKPLPIDKTTWPGVFTSGIDAVVVLPITSSSSSRGKAFFFRGGEFVQFDLSTHSTDTGFPQPVSEFWKAAAAAAAEASSSSQRT